MLTIYSCACLDNGKLVQVFMSFETHNQCFPYRSVTGGYRRFLPIPVTGGIHKPTVNFEIFCPNLKFSKKFEIKKEKIW